MILDNLFSMVGSTGTAGILLGVVALAGFPAFSSVFCPYSALKRLQPRGR